MLGLCPVARRAQPEPASDGSAAAPANPQAAFRRNSRRVCSPLLPVLTADLHFFLPRLIDGSQPTICRRLSVGPSSQTCNKPQPRRARRAQGHQVREKSATAEQAESTTRSHNSGRFPPSGDAESELRRQRKLMGSAPSAPELCSAGYCGKRNNRAGKRKVPLPKHQLDTPLFAADNFPRSSMRSLRPYGETALFASPQSQTGTDA